MNSEESLSSVYEAIGEEGFTAFVAAFYRRVREDDVIGPMYPEDDWAGSEKRLRDFLIFRFGGPDRYIKERGHPRLGMRHVPFAIGAAARDRWIDLMREALNEADLTPDIQRVLLSFFIQVARFLQNRPD